MHTSLVCSLNGDSYDPGTLQGLSKAGKPLLARYDLDSIAGQWSPSAVRSSTIRSMWKFFPVMPVDGPDQAISLGEGDTPLIPATRRGPFAAFDDLLIKDESFNPTQSFKARGMSAAITRAAALGVQTVALPSAGNAAGAATAYAARAGMKCVIFVPEDTPPANILESVCGGATVYLVNGLISDCGKLCRQACDRFGWFDLSTLKEPFRLEGKKTMGYELAFDLAEMRKTSALQLPDVILYPTGGGTGLIGMWKAFDEMEQLGWIGSQRPRMVVVQAEGCAPIVLAYQQGQTSAPLFPNAATIASGLRVPAAVGDFLMLDIVRSSNGTAVTVSDEELMFGVKELAQWQGIHAAPEGGAIWIAAQRLLQQGWLHRNETIMLFNTGAAVKYNHLLRADGLKTLNHQSPTVLDDIKP
ncbi:MAG: threonine synthase [Planctomyces sp.]|nr:threonine synthase [Planctomyces sp.]